MREGEERGGGPTVSIGYVTNSTSMTALSDCQLLSADDVMPPTREPKSFVAPAAPHLEEGAEAATTRPARTRATVRTASQHAVRCRDTTALAGAGNLSAGAARAPSAATV